MQAPIRLQYAQDGAIVVPINDTRTQCTTSLTPIKEWLPLDAQRMVKNPKENKILKPLKSWPRTNQGIYYHSGCNSGAQPIGPSMQVRHAKHNYPLHIGPQQALVCQPQTRLWPHTPRATINSSPGSLCSGAGADPQLRHSAINLPGSKEHFRDAIQAPN